MRELDDAIGQILEKVRQVQMSQVEHLEQVRQAEPSRRATLVLFTSDNGADLNGRERAGGRDAGYVVSLPQDQVDRCSAASRPPLKEVSGPQHFPNPCQGCALPRLLGGVIGV